MLLWQWGYHYFHHPISYNSVISTPIILLECILKRSVVAVCSHLVIYLLVILENPRRGEDSFNDCGVGRSLIWTIEVC